MKDESTLPVKYTSSARYRCLENLHKESLELYLKYCGLEECDAGHVYGPTERDEFLIHIILDGEGTYIVNNQTFKLKKNQAFLIRPGVSTVYKADVNTPWKYIWIGFDGTKAEEYLRFAGFREDNPVQTFKCIDQLKKCVIRILKASQLTIANSLIRESQLMEFLALLIKEKQANSKSDPVYSAQIYVDHAIEYIENHLQEQIKIQDIAKYIGIDRSYLTYCFKKQLNMSPQEYFIEYRLHIAAGLLKSTNVSIAGVAERIGYTDPFSFSKAFKKLFRMSPKNYRAYKEEIKLASKKYE